MTAPDVHQMTSTDILLILGGIGTLVCSIISALKTTTTGRKVDGTKAHLEKQDEKLETIHTQTNGNLTTVQAQLETARREVAELKAAAAAKAEAASELVAEIRRSIAAPVVIADRRQTGRTTKGRK